MKGGLDLRGKILMGISSTEKRSIHKNSVSCNIRLGSLKSYQFNSEQIIQIF